MALYGANKLVGVCSVDVDTTGLNTLETKCCEFGEFKFDKNVDVDKVKFFYRSSSPDVRTVFDKIVPDFGGNMVEALED